MARAKQTARKAGPQARVSRRGASGRGDSGNDPGQEGMEIDADQAAVNESGDGDPQDVPQEGPEEEEDDDVAPAAGGGGNGGGDDDPSSEDSDEDEDEAESLPRADDGDDVPQDPFAEGGAFYISPYENQVLALLIRIGIHREMATRLMFQEGMMTPEALLLRYDEAISNRV